MLKKFGTKIKLGILGLAFLGFGACSTTQTLPPGGANTESIITACTSYGTALKSIIPIKSTMSPSGISSVDTSIRLVDPICSNPASYSTPGALQAILTETANLKTILAKGGK